MAKDVNRHWAIYWFTEPGGFRRLEMQSYVCYDRDPSWMFWRQWKEGAQVDVVFIAPGGFTRA